MARYLALAFALTNLVGCVFNGDATELEEPADAAVPDVDAEPPVVDSDEDGILDPDDNCPQQANADQDDEDEDGVGDLCDNCPQRSNPDQQDLGEGERADGVGDLCDPRPEQPGDQLLFFDGFNSLSAEWGELLAEDSSWTVSGGVLRQTSDAAQTRVLARTLSTAEDAALWIDLDYVIEGIRPPGGNNDTVRSIGAVAFYRGPEEGPFGFGIACVEVASDPTNTFANLAAIDGTTFDSGNSALTSWPFIAGVPRSLQLGAAQTGPSRCTLRIEGSTPIQPPDSELPARRGQSVGLRTLGVSARVPFIAVYQLGSE